MLGDHKDSTTGNLSTPTPTETGGGHVPLDVNVTNAADITIGTVAQGNPSASSWPVAGKGGEQLALEVFTTS